MIYYDKLFSRAQVLADKGAYVRHWPVRRYAEVSGSSKARCDSDRSHGAVSIVMSWPG